MHDKSIVLLFIKAPVKGRVKSRLAAAIGDDAALELYKNFVSDVVEMLKDTGHSFRICFYPASAGASVSRWLGHGHQYMPQDGNDLGERMERGFSRVFSEGFTRAVLIGSDIPDLKKSVISKALDSLEKSDAALGPAADGGYYLIGFNRNSFRKELFRGIPWSTRKVFEETVNMMRTKSLTIHFLPEWEDVDSLADLKSLFERNRQGGFLESRTMAYLKMNAHSLFRDTIELWR